MKELDLLLEQFIKNNQEDLLKGSWPELEDLLRLEDDVLWDYLQNPESGQAASFAPLLDRIRLPRA